jgi:hypothetical protein
MYYVLGRSECQYGFENKPMRSSKNTTKRISDLDFADEVVLLENNIRVVNSSSNSSTIRRLQVPGQVNNLQLRPPTWASMVRLQENGENLERQACGSQPHN